MDESVTPEEHNLGSMCRKTTDRETTISGDAALVDSSAVKFSCLSRVQQKNMKFLVPVVHRSRIRTRPSQSL